MPSDTTTSPTALHDRSPGGVVVNALGPLQVRGHSVTPSQRSLLAALVLTRRTGATTDDLIDALWPRGAPVSARASVQNQITRLRRALGTGTIVTRDGRYVLGVSTDVDRFEEVALATAQPVGTVAPATIERGLALWRGIPFGELADHHDAQVARVRLTSVRAQLVERLAVERLARGRYDDAATALHVHVADEPFHERAWELLIAARYLAGRRTEALADYVTLEDVLAERLDIRPSAALRQLRVTIATERPLNVHELLPPAARPAVRHLDDRRPA